MSEFTASDLTMSMLQAQWKATRSGGGWLCPNCGSRLAVLDARDNQYHQPALALPEGYTYVYGIWKRVKKTRMRLNRQEIKKVDAYRRRIASGDKSFSVQTLSADDTKFEAEIGCISRRAGVQHLRPSANASILKEHFPATIECFQCKKYVKITSWRG